MDIVSKVVPTASQAASTPTCFLFYFNIEKQVLYKEMHINMNRRVICNGTFSKIGLP